METPRYFIRRGLLVLACLAHLGCKSVRDRTSTTPVEQVRACQLLTELLQTAWAAAKADEAACCSHEWGTSVEIKRDLEEKAWELRRSRLLKGLAKKRLRGARKDDFANALRSRCGFTPDRFVATPVQCTDPTIRASASRPPNLTRPLRSAPRDIDRAALEPRRERASMSTGSTSSRSSSSLTGGQTV